jgi:hypothetical protein
MSCSLADTHKVPCPSPGVDLELVGDEVLMYNPEATRAVYLNPTAALVWGMCNGERTISDIIAVLAESYADAKHVLAEDVVTALNHLEENGVLVLSGN